MLRNLATPIREQRFQRRKRLTYGFEFRVSSFEFRVSSFEFRVSSSGGLPKLGTRNSKLSFRGYRVLKVKQTSVLSHHRWPGHRDWRVTAVVYDRKLSDASANTG